jgi:hypothetical protein
MFNKTTSKNLKKHSIKRTVSILKVSKNQTQAFLINYDAVMLIQFFYCTYVHTQVEVAFAQEKRSKIVCFSSHIYFLDFDKNVHRELHVLYTYAMNHVIKLVHNQQFHLFTS